ncbi:MAG TPA: hypothetical protein VL988_10035 [Solirubrobacteraceae bacterium]|nr:hypothetical protein [Solirubrobacteraceae bacterium]
MAREERRRRIDWASADVHEGEVTLKLTGRPSKAWRERFEKVLGLLGSGGSGWGGVRLKKSTVTVEALQPQAEGELRHFLESVVAQTNAELPEEPGDEQDTAGGSREEILDAEMTATLRSFASAD